MTTQDVLNDIAAARTRDDAATVYALAIVGRLPFRGWKPVNEAIIEKWSVSGLRYIKERAWKLAASARADRAERSHLEAAIRRDLDAGLHDDCGEDCPAKTAHAKLREALSGSGGSDGDADS